MSAKHPRRSHVTHEVIEGRVRGLGRNGDGAVETTQGIVFVGGVLPGESVRIEVTGRARGVLRGRLTEVLSPSVDRVKPVCPHQGRCGGCPLMTLSVTAQRAEKRTALEAAVTRFGSAALAVAMTESPHELGYRARARLAFSCEFGGKGRKLGYRRDGSHRLSDVDHCSVLDDICQSGLAVAREKLLPELAGEGEIQIGHGQSELPVLWVHCSVAQSPACYAMCERLVADHELAGLTLSVEDGAVVARFGEPRQLAIGADGQALWGPAAGFSQSNPAINRALCTFVEEMAAPAGKRLLELFCGHGNLTVLLAKAALSLHAVESDPEAVEACRRNLAERGLGNTHVHQGSADSYQPKGRIDVVVLDPPRTGARFALPMVLSMRPQTIVYVSCDLPTLARDLATLHQAGYAVDAAHAFDMFPQTAHVEAVVRLRLGR